MSKLTIYKGNSESIQLEVTDADGNVYPLTGITVLMDIVGTKNDDDFVLQKSSDNVEEINIIEPANGKAIIYLLPEDTMNMEGNYDYEITLIQGEDFKKTIVKDVLKVLKTITIPES